MALAEITRQMEVYDAYIDLRCIDRTREIAGNRVGRGCEKVGRCDTHDDPPLRIPRSARERKKKTDAQTKGERNKTRRNKIFGQAILRIFAGESQTDSAKSRLFPQIPTPLGIFPKKRN